MLNARAQLLFDYYFNGFYLGFPQPPSQHSQFKQALSLLIFYHVAVLDFFLLVSPLWHFAIITMLLFLSHPSVS